MKPLATVALCLWGAATLMLAAEPAKPAAPAKPAKSAKPDVPAKPAKPAESVEPAAKPEAAKPEATKPAPPSTPAEPDAVLVVTHDKTPLMYGNQKTGQLQEGTRVTLIKAHGEWSLVRITLGANWCQGWMRSALLVPDSLADVPLRVGRASRKYTYRRATLPGRDFVEVPVKFEPTAKSPSRVYLHFDNPDTADLYLDVGNDTKVLPYGFMRRRPMSKRRVFDGDEKTQTLLLKPGKPLIETYIFAVPTRVRSFRLVIKDTKHTVRIGR